MSKWSSLHPYFERDLQAAGPILQLVAAKHGVPVDEVVGKSRKAGIVAARRAAILLISGQFDWSLPRIGRVFGCDHTSILHHLDVVTGERPVKRERKRACALARLQRLRQGRGA